jgi:hypothetical protein
MSQEYLQCIEEYEKEQEEELKETKRKTRIDCKKNISEVEIDPERLKEIVLTKKQIKKLEVKEKKERSQKQKEAFEKAREIMLTRKDLRKDKEKEGIILKIKEPNKYPKVHKKNKPIESESESESEEEEEKPKFQKRKPKLDDIEEKVERLNKINQVIENPYYAMIMKSRMKR